MKEGQEGVEGEREARCKEVGKEGRERGRERRKGKEVGKEGRGGRRSLRLEQI